MSTRQPFVSTESFRRAAPWLGIVLLATGAAVISIAGTAAGDGIFRGETREEVQRSAMTNERGQWTTECEHRSDKGTKVWLQFLLRGQEGVWVPLPAGQPAGITPGQEVRFELRREAGTFSFAGKFDGTGPGCKGAGSFTFQTDPRYRSEMEALGYQVPSGDKLVELAVRDVSPSYVRQLQDLGYRDLSLSRLVELRSHDVTPELIRELADLGYRSLPASRLIEFRMFDVSPALIRELATLDYSGLPAERLVEFRVQEVTPKFIRELAALGYHYVAAEKLVEMRVQGVDIEFIRDLMSRGYRNLSPTELIDLRMGASAQHAGGARR